MSTETPQVKEKELSTQVLSKVESFTNTGELVLPTDYSPANALKGAMLILAETQTRDKKPVLQACTKESIAKAMLKMVVQGLSPLKSQGYFIPYGDQLTWSRSYQGSIALARRVGGVSDVVANIVYKEDVFEYKVNTETGRKELVKHEQKFENIDNGEIKGAYAIISYEDGRTDLVVMTIKEIETAWGQGATKGNSPAHKNFRQEMAKKTVINRACKTPINSSSDVHLFVGRDEENKVPLEEKVKEEIKEETASETIEFEEVQTEEAKVVPPEQEVQDENEEPPY